MEHSPCLAGNLLLVKNFPICYGTHKFITMFVRAHEYYSEPDESRPHTHFKIQFNITLL
jgi:hypothetical protein